MPVVVRTIASAVVDHVNAYAVAQGAAVRVARGTPPAGSGWQGTPGNSAFVGYAVLWSLSSPSGGTLAAPDNDFDYGFQATCVGAMPDQADFVGDLVAAALRTKPTLPAGRGTTRVAPEELGRHSRDDSTDPPLFARFDRYLLLTAPTL